MGKGMKKSRKWFLLLGTIFKSLRHLKRCGNGIVSSAEQGVAIYSRHAQLGVEVQRKKGNKHVSELFRLLLYIAVGLMWRGNFYIV